MKNTSDVDWKRLAEIKDEGIYISDIPGSDKDFFHNAKITVPSKQADNFAHRYGCANVV